MIRKYEDKDYSEVKSITIDKWKEEKMISKNNRFFLHTLLTKYCYINQDLSFVNYSSKIDAFIFASYKDDKPNCYDWFIENIAKMNQKSKKEALEYFKYLEYNHDKVVHHMKDKDIYVSLLASNKKGAGKELLELIENTAKKDNGHIFLWTDETCSYEYYHKNNFFLMEEYIITFNNEKIKTFIYKK